MRRRVDRIDAQDQQRLNLACIDIGTQFAERFQVIHWMRFHRFGVVERCPNIAERGIDLVHECVQRRGLMLSGNH